VNYTTACQVISAHQPVPRPQWINWLLPERCRTCGNEWPCPPRRLAGAIIRSSAEHVR
jgi:hypothetical protein